MNDLTYEEAKEIRNQIQTELAAAKESLDLIVGDGRRSSTRTSNKRTS